jgi:hypothetical protein
MILTNCAKQQRRSEPHLAIPGSDMAISRLGDRSLAANTFISASLTSNASTTAPNLSPNQPSETPRHETRCKKWKTTDP